MITVPWAMEYTGVLRKQNRILRTMIKMDFQWVEAATANMNNRYLKKQDPPSPSIPKSPFLLGHMGEATSRTEVD